MLKYFYPGRCIQCILNTRWNSISENPRDGSIDCPLNRIKIDPRQICKPIELHCPPLSSAWACRKKWSSSEQKWGGHCDITVRTSRDRLAPICGMKESKFKVGCMRFWVQWVKKVQDAPWREVAGSSPSSSSPASCFELHIKIISMARRLKTEELICCGFQKPISPAWPCFRSWEMHRIA